MHPRDNNLIAACLYDNIRHILHAFSKQDLEKVPSGRFIQLQVDEECNLRTFIEHSDSLRERKLRFQRGNAFCELSPDKSEDIIDKQEVILMDVVRLSR